MDDLLDLLHPLAGLVAVGVMVGAELLVLALWTIDGLRRMRDGGWFGGALDWPRVFQRSALVSMFAGVPLGLLGLLVDPLAALTVVAVALGAVLMSMLLWLAATHDWLDTFPEIDWKPVVRAATFPFSPGLGLLAGGIVQLILWAQVTTGE